MNTGLLGSAHARLYGAQLALVGFAHSFLRSWPRSCGADLLELVLVQVDFVQHIDTTGIARP
jgi:hypothetical protein